MSSFVTNTNSPEVARGSDDQLFLVGGNQKVIEYVIGERPILSAGKAIFKKNLINRAAYCAERGAKYRHIVCPDKHSVYLDHFPYEAKFIVGSVLLEYCEGGFDFPVEELKKIEGEGSYLKTDSHWTTSGQIEFVAQCLKGLGLPDDVFAARKPRIYEQRIDDLNPFCGDLGSKLEPRQTEMRTKFLPFPEVTILSNKVSGSNGALFTAMNYDAPLGRLLVIGDSFVISCLSLFALFFKEIVLVRSPYFHREMVDLFKPEFVLTSNVERYLPHMPTDEQAPLALLMAFLLNKESQADVGFHETLNAFLSPALLVHERFIAARNNPK